ncbi:sortase [Parageobacillus sp. VR-IP]|uniref:sortase n=1 Tax=Parageobacillus sp. VR-IP TaxID=2742205 RepID=UPI001582FB8E|nr:sortase [Parageobacillus sp. VR-IP]
MYFREILTPIILHKILDGTLTYKVFNKKIVKPTEIDVIYPIKNKSMVTLVTCYPKYSDKQRLIVFTELETEQIKDGRNKF